MKNFILTISAFALNLFGFSQTGFPPPVATNPSTAVTNANAAWYRGGNFPVGTSPAGANIFGTRWASDIWIMTNNEVTSFFSHNNGLFGISNTGDGLRILNQNSSPGGVGEIDIFTSDANHTEIRWGGSGNIRGAFNRFEVQANYRGLYFNTRESIGIYKFARLDNVTAVIGTNNFWRIGMQTDAFPAINGARRLEVVDNAPQFRLHFGGVNATGGPNTDFFSNGAGNLQIMPTGQRVGINAPTNPTATLDVFGDARIRNVAAATPNALIVGVADGGAGNLRVRRLDFTGNAGQVLLGNGTWGTAPGAVTANNGLSVAGGNVQLGAPCTSLFPVLASTFTSSRVIFLNGNSFWMFSGAAQSGGVGFGAQPASAGLCGVGNTVEISANNQGNYGNTNASGLRFTKLTSISPTVANGTNGVDNSKLLTVDENGDVVLADVPPGSGNGFFDCTDNTGAADLLVDSKVNLNNQNLFFENNDALGQNHIGMGYDCGTALPGKLSVLQTHPMTINASTVGISGMNTDIANTVLLQYSGVYGEASGIQNPVNRTINIGGDFRALNAPLNFGVSGFVEVPATYPTGLFNYNVGGNFKAIGPGFSNVGGLFQGYGASNINYGIHTSVSSNPGSFNCAILAIAPSETNHFAAHFTGDVFMNGVIVSTSDENLKENIVPIDDAMDIISVLKPVSFDFKQTGIYDRMDMPEGNRFGLIAQEVETILPGLIKPSTFPASYDSLGNEIDAAIDFLTLEYEAFIPILIKGLQEQQVEINEKDSIINDLNNRLTNLENCLSGILPLLCHLNNSAISPTQEEVQQELAKAIDIELSDKNNIVLNQNVPNPFAEKTVISYSIPETVGKAQIHFYDGKGNLINTVDLVERGRGEINVYANDLSSGVYTYSLVADGQIVSTKRMMKH